MKTTVFIFTIALILAAIAGCGLEGSGQPVPPLLAAFNQGARIPGWILEHPTAGRADVRAKAVHEGGQWKLVLSRTFKRRPRDVAFSIALADDGTAHSGIQRLLLTADTSATPGATTIVTHEVTNGQVTPDGSLTPGEWDLLTFQSLTLEVQNTLPDGLYALPGPVDLTIASAYDEEFIYFFMSWQDPGGSASDLGPLLQWDGAGWIARPHAANDVNGNGVLDPGEAQNVLAPAEDEDRLMLFFPIEDESMAFAPKAAGCAASCHAASTSANNFGPAGHYQVTGRNLLDVWEWGAASTAPGRGSRDRQLLHQGFSDDAGSPGFLVKDPLTPAFMFSTSPAGFESLIGEGLVFEQPPPGYPQLPAIPANAVPYDPGNFNSSGSGPVAWLGTSPFAGNDYLPAYVQVQPDESQGDVEVGATFAAGEWTLEIRRRRVTRFPDGSPRPDDVQFDEDADFIRGALQVGTAHQGMPFSVSVTDRAGGHGLRETRYEGPILLSADVNLLGAVFADRLVIVDYGAGFQPLTVADFSDTRVTKPPPSAGDDRALTLKAGTDGGASLFVAATWNDLVADTRGRSWDWNGFTWEILPEDGEDELRLLFAGSVPRSTFLNGGCAVLCHDPASGLQAPAWPAFGTTLTNHVADLWHWRAGRSLPLDTADDSGIDWRFFGQANGTQSAVALHGDGGNTPFRLNDDTVNALPLLMAPNDPNANAPFIGIGLSTVGNAIPFADPTAGLPPSAVPTPQAVSFSQEIQPIFQANCTVCHFSGGFGGLDLTSWSSLMAGGASGAVIVPGDPAASLIIQRLEGTVPPLMPQGGPPLPAADISLISQWITEGAADT